MDQESVGGGRGRKPGPCVLLVEPNPVLREVLTEAIEGEGCLVFPAATGRRAIELVASLRLDMVIIDEGSGGDARALCRFILGMEQLASASTLLIDGDATSLGDQHSPPQVCLHKPFDLQEFLTALRIAFAHTGHVEAS